jgi:hypothetical protein
VSPAWEGVLGSREDAITVAHHIIARHRDDAERFVAEQLEDAEARRDGDLITRWLLVREAVRDLLRDDPDSRD